MLQSLNNRQILLGITGGIAAYKSAELVRRLRDAGASVRVVMSRGAQQFITPLTLQALSGNPVHTELLDPAAEAGMGHIELARWAERIIIAPATADFIARLAGGRADDLLATLCLASQAPIALAPAMNQGMWRNAATQANAATLLSRGLQLWGPDEGYQACGDIGPGRMLDPAALVEQLATQFQPAVLAATRVVITAGPTREAIDPVRYISNHSSGKMGFALAGAARDAGAEVCLIAGPVTLTTPAGVTRIDVQSAEQMYQAALAQMGQCDIFIATAAVADYRPCIVADHKIKKTDTQMQVVLERNPDIVAAVASHPQRPFTVGFAAETQALDDYARDKLARKNLDMIIANDVSDHSIGFNSEDNEVVMFWPDGQQRLPRASKQQLGRQLIAEIAQHFRRAHGGE